jgi:hypothetical protein
MAALLLYRRGMGAFLAVLGALMWSLGFVVWAFVGAAATECIVTVSGTTSCSSMPLVDGLGLEALALLAPAAVCLAVWALLRRYCSAGRRLAYVGAVVLVGLFAVFCWLAGLSIGVLLAPIALLLMFAVAATSPPPGAFSASMR